MSRRRRKNEIITLIMVMFCIVLIVVLALVSVQRMQLEKEYRALQEEMEGLKQEYETLQEQAKADEEETESSSSEEESKEAQTAGDIQQVILTSIAQYQPGQVLEASQLDLNHPDAYFTSKEILLGDEVYNRINGKSYQENPNIGLDSLRYIKLLHYNFQGQIQVGELIVHKNLENDILSIFKELFQNQYQIQSMFLVDNYWTGDGNDSDYASIDVNNTSAFNYRPISGGGKLSNHAYGCAIDINPQQNPYVIYSNGSPVNWSHTNANDFIDRTTGAAHVITHDDICYKIFLEHGFSWGGDWESPRDYQHFEKEVY